MQMRPVQIIAADIEHLTDARYFAAHEVDFISFRYNTSESMEGGLNVDAIQSITEWIEGPKLIVHCTDFEQFRAINPEACLFEYRQELDYNNQVLPDLVRFKLRKIENFDVFVSNGISGTDLVIHADHLILDLRSCGISAEDLLQGAALEALQSISAATSLFIDVSCNAKTLFKLIEQINPEGIVIRGGSEEKAGYKSFEELDELFELLSAETI